MLFKAEAIGSSISFEATPKTWGSSVLMWTGSMWTNIKLRRKAVKKVKDDNPKPS